MLNRTSSNPAALVTLYVGNKNDGLKLVIHKDFACHYSPVFEKAFNSVFVEGQTQTYVLHGTTKEAAQLLVYWIYTQTLDMAAVKETAVKDSLTIFQLWVLADNLIIPRLHNALLREILARRTALNETPTGSLGYLYANTATGSPLRRLMVHLCCNYLDVNWFTNHSTQFPKEMLTEVVTYLINDIDPEKSKAKKRAFDISTLEVQGD
jgi:hypothetical protein